MHEVASVRECEEDYGKPRLQAKEEEDVAGAGDVDYGDGEGETAASRRDGDTAPEHVGSRTVSAAGRNRMEELCRRKGSARSGTSTRVVAERSGGGERREMWRCERDSGIGDGLGDGVQVRAVAPEVHRGDEGREAGEGEVST